MELGGIIGSSARPAAPHNVDIGFRIAAGRKRPDHVVNTGWIYVVVNDDGKTILISSRETLRGDHSSLLGMSRISLFDGHHRKLPRTRLVRPDAFNVGHAGFLEIFPDVRRTRNRAQQSARVRRARRIRAGEDRIIAIKNPLDADERLGTFSRWRNSPATRQTVLHLLARRVLSRPPTRFQHPQGRGGR